MPRPLYLTDHRERDAHVQFERPSTAARTRYQVDGRPAHSARFIKSTERERYDALLSEANDDPELLAQLLVAGDPEIAMEHVGRRVRYTDRVWLSADGDVLYAAQVLKVVHNPDGEEVERTDFVDIEATVTMEEALPFTGKLFPIDKVVRRFVLSRTLQLSHVNGLTYDFLFELAAHLESQNAMLLVGTGRKGRAPLIFQTNGAPYRGFLEGRTSGKGYKLLLHLSNLELKVAK